LEVIEEGERIKIINRKKKEKKTTTSEEKRGTLRTYRVE
jgi:hypothetical protein